MTCHLEGGPCCPWTLLEEALPILGLSAGPSGWQGAQQCDTHAPRKACSRPPCSLSEPLPLTWVFLSPGVWDSHQKWPWEIFSPGSSLLRLGKGALLVVSLTGRPHVDMNPAGVFAELEGNRGVPQTGSSLHGHPCPAALLRSSGVLEGTRFLLAIQGLEVSRESWLNAEGERERILTGGPMGPGSPGCPRGPLGPGGPGGPGGPWMPAWPCSP